MSEDNGPTPEETMTIAAAREVKDRQVLLVGVGPPNAAANLARRLHAPDAVLIYESGAIGARLVWWQVAHLAFSLKTRCPVRAEAALKPPAGGFGVGSDSW